MSDSRDRLGVFYHGAAWRRCKQAYMQSVGYLCESCLERGLYEPAVEVHHITPLTVATVDDPEQSLNFANLRAVCAKCHRELHRKEPPGRRYRIDMDTGHVEWLGEGE